MKSTIDAMKKLRAALDPDDWIGEITMHDFIDRIIATEEAQTVEPVLWQELSEDGEPLCDEGTFSESSGCFDFERPLFTCPSPATESAAADAPPCRNCGGHGLEPSVYDGLRPCNFCKPAQPATETTKPSAGEREAIAQRLRLSADDSRVDYCYSGTQMADLMREAADMLAADALEIADLSDRIIANEEAQTVEPAGIIVEAGGMMLELDFYRDLPAGTLLYTHPAPAAEPATVTCQIYGHVVGACVECNTHSEPAKSSAGYAHEIWAAAQLVPGEGIEDGVVRVEALLNAPRVPMTRDQVDDLAEDSIFLQTIYGIVRSIEAHHQIGVKS